MDLINLRLVPDSAVPRVFELTESKVADLHRWVDDLIREEGQGWPFAADSTFYEGLLADAREYVEIGKPDYVPWLVRWWVEGAIRYEG